MTARHSSIWQSLLLVLFLGGCDDTPLEPGAVFGELDGSTLEMDSEPLPLPPIMDEGVEADDGVETDGSEESENDCMSNDDCDSRYCVPDPEGRRVCTERCGDQDDCPEGWECAPVANTRPDVVLICVAIRRVQCDTCEHDGHCGAGPDRCIQIGRSQRCARDCSTEECPEGNTCEMQTIDDVEVPLCIPDVGSCAPCVDPDGDGYGVEGECLGLDCDEENPMTNAGATEVCDGVDNDCDSIPDNNVGAEDAPAEFTCLSAGVCAGAVASCSGGAWGCTYPNSYQADAELTCDGLDNDCDESVDEALDAPAAELVVGVCVDAVLVCDGEEGYVEPDYEAIEGYEAEEVSCDGLDNDCDNQTDEAVERPLADHQDGLCAGTFQVCGGDGGFVEPDYGQIEGYENVEATCDGLDNDCDGSADEALLPPQGDHQAGVCAGALQVCGGVDGFVEPDYGQMANYEADESVCDGLDNDCDTHIDEGVALGLAERQEGVCGGSRQVCAGPAGLQEPDYGAIAIYEAVERTCDGNDNDCDGRTDEALQPPLAGNQRGICAGALQICAGYDGFADPDYAALDNHEADEQTCDGLDNDCDGEVDEDVPVGPAALQDGVCAESVQICAGPAGLQDPNYGGIPSYENVESTCDGLDNDCDGSADEGLQEPQGENQIGICAGALKVCDGVNGFVEPNYGAIEGHQAEENTCDGLDNDCDASVDEGVVLGLADRQDGVCAESRKICAAQAGIQEPNYGGIATYENVERTCDGLDNDCDGNVDEAIDPPAADTQDGVCAGAVRVCGAEAGFVEPNYGEIEAYEGDEVTCDGLDNDCDGSADEAIDQPLADNQNGVCAGALKQCRGQDGFLDPDYADIDGYEIDETTCDGLDNDCDGVVDEGIDLGLAEIQFGICAGVTKVCGGAQGIVEPDYTQLADYAADDQPADNLDTNCDGVVGTADRMVFVSSLGDDGADGLTPGAAVAGIQRGLDIAAATAGRDTVAVATDSYGSNATLGLLSGVGLYGGFSRDFSTRDATLATFETTAAIGVEAAGLQAATWVNGLEVVVADQDGAGVEAIGLRYHGSADHLHLVNVRIRVGSGGNGTAGVAGAAGVHGGRGGNANGRDPGAGGAGGGGAGGRGNERGAGNAGQGGSNNAARGGAGGDPNNGGLHCGDGDVQRGGNGQSGSNANNGANNAAGNAIGSFQGLDWVPSLSGNGSSGGGGGGAGGGAAGGGENCTTEECVNIPLVGRVCTPDVCVFCGTGRGGGGGGGGGGAGRGGTRGLSGGASIGVLMSGSILHLADAQIVVAGGGTGGEGGAGGAGGQGGAGGAGASSNSDSDGDGGNGGTGGRGGSGSCGAGGTGGPSVGIWGIADARVVRAGAEDDQIAAGGAGGASCGNAGNTGISAAYRGVDL